MKFYRKVRDLLHSCLPGDQTEPLQDCRSVFKQVVRIVENFDEMRKEIR